MTSRPRRNHSPACNLDRPHCSNNRDHLRPVCRMPSISTNDTTEAPPFGGAPLPPDVTDRP